MASERKFGLDVVGNIPWGTHLCQFYETKHHLTEIRVSYFAEGLRSNEACMWVTSEPLEVEEAAAALEKAVPHMDRFIEMGSFLFFPTRNGTLRAEHLTQTALCRGGLKRKRNRKR